MLKASILLVLCVLLTTGCKTTAPPEDLVVTPGNALMAPKKVRELRLALGPAVEFVPASQDRTDISLGGDVRFWWGMTSRLNYVFPLGLRVNVLSPSWRSKLILSGGLNGYSCCFSIGSSRASTFYSDVSATFAHDFNPRVTAYAGYLGVVKTYLVQEQDAFVKADSYAVLGLLNAIDKLTLEHKLMTGVIQDARTFEQEFRFSAQERLTYPVRDGLHAYGLFSASYYNRYSVRSALSSRFFTGIAAGAVWRY